MPATAQPAQPAHLDGQPFDPTAGPCADGDACTPCFDAYYEPGGGGPRAFYVTVVDGRQRGLLLGPLPTHQAALDRVEDVRAWVTARDPRAHFYGFGTASAPAAGARPGRLNDRIPA